MDGWHGELVGQQGLEDMEDRDLKMIFEIIAQQRIESQDPGFTVD